MQTQLPIIVPDPVSLSTHHLHMGLRETDTVLSSATGFVFRKDEEDFLVTNWHNCAGRDPATGECLSSTLGTPDVVVTFFRDPLTPAKLGVEHLSLYKDAEMREPAWYEHPVHGKRVDVVVLPLPAELSSKYRLYPINALDFSSQFKEEVADDAFVIGYPFSDLSYSQLPIWKRASIASEPDVDVDSLPKMLIDTATRAGLSGAPVIMQRVGLHGAKGGTVSGDTIIGRIRNFIGVYSGRIGNDDMKAQLGIVWKARVVLEIIEGRKWGSTHLGM